MARFLPADVGVPGPAPPARGAAAGPARLPRARPIRGCARGFCGLRGRVRPLPASGLPPALAAPLRGRWPGGSLWPSGASSRVPRSARFRASPPCRSPSRLRWPRPSGAGPRPSLGASFPPAAAPRRPCGPRVWAAGAVPAPSRRSCALPSARAASLRLALLRFGRGWARGAACRWRVPPSRPAPAGRLRPRSSAPGAARRPAGGFLAASRPPALRRVSCDAAPAPSTSDRAEHQR